MEKRIKLVAAHQKFLADAKALVDGADTDLTEEQQTQFDSLIAGAEKTKKEIENYDKLAGMQAAADKMVEAPSLGRQVKPGSAILDDPNAVPNHEAKFVVPAKAKRWSGHLEAFKGPEGELDAYRAGMWLAASLIHNDYAQKFCNQHGIPVNSVQFQNIHTEGTNTTGGYLVFDEYENTIIRLVEDYGVVRNLFRNTPMISDTKSRPSRTGGLEANFIGEGGAITASTGAWEMVKLVAKKLAAITTASNELVSDAIISIADQATQEIALAFATKEDLCGIRGDGTSTYGGMHGIATKLLADNGVDDGGGLVLAAGKTFAEVTDANLLAMIGRIPNFPGMRSTWVCSKAFWWGVMVRLQRTAGGVTLSDMANAGGPTYGGYPVVLTSGSTAMPTTDTTSQLACMFGDFTMAADFGDRAGMALAVSNDAYVGSASMFETDSFAIRGIERFDINVHHTGTSTVTGPVIGLCMAAS